LAPPNPSGRLHHLFVCLETLALVPLFYFFSVFSDQLNVTLAKNMNGAGLQLILREQGINKKNTRLHYY